MIPSSLILRTVEIPIIQRKYSILTDISIRFSYSNLLFSGKCCTVEFNSTYPVQLEGIIEQTEFEESIQNINQAISQRDSFIMVDLLPEICLLIGIILMLAGGVVFMFFILPIIPVLIAVACSTFVFGMIFVVFGCCLIQADLSDQMQQAIARESTKYSTRTPTPCSWRLNLRRIHAGNLDNYGVSDILPIHRFDTILKNIFCLNFRSLLRLDVILFHNLEIVHFHRIAELVNKYHPLFNQTILLHLHHTIAIKQLNFVLNVACQNRIQHRDSVHPVVDHSMCKTINHKTKSRYELLKSIADLIPI